MANAVGCFARAARGGGGAGSWARRRAACDLLADRPLRRAAAARRELALAICFVLHCCGGTRPRVKHKHHGWCWLVLVPLFIMNSPVMVHLAQPSSLDVLVLVGVQIR